MQKRGPHQKQTSGSLGGLNKSVAAQRLKERRITSEPGVYTSDEFGVLGTMPMTLNNGILTTTTGFSNIPMSNPAFGSWMHSYATLRDYEDATAPEHILAAIDEMSIPAGMMGE